MQILMSLMVGLTLEPSLVIRPQSLDRLEIQVANTGTAASLPQTLTYRLAEDGKVMAESQLNLPTLAPGATRNLVLGGKDKLLRSPGSEAFLSVFLKDRASGSLSKSAQFLIPGGREPVAFEVPRGEVKLTETGDTVEVIAGNVRAAFRKSTGEWVQLLRDSRPLLTRPPYISAGSIGQLTSSGDPKRVFKSLRVLKARGGIAAQIQVIHEVGQPAVKVETSYTFLADATVVVDTHFSQLEGLANLPRLGHQFEFHPRDQVVNFFGDGPVASYFDARQPVDLFTQAADDAPHREVRWARWNLVSGPMLVLGSPTFALSGERASSGGRVVGVDALHRGQKEPIPIQRMTSPQNYRFTLRFGGANPRQVPPVTRAPMVFMEDGMVFANPRDASRKLSMRVDGGQVVPFVPPVKPGIAKQIEVFAEQDGWITGPGEKISLSPPKTELDRR